MCGLIVALAISIVPSAYAATTVYATDTLDLVKYGTTIVFAEDNVFDAAYREQDNNSTYPSMWFFTNNSITYGLCPQSENINVTEIGASGFKYTKSGAGTETFYASSNPSTAKIDLVTTATGWNYSENLITVTGALSEVEFTFTLSTDPTPTPDPNSGGYPSGGGQATPTPSGDGGAISPTPSPPSTGGFDFTTGIIIVCVGVLVALLVTNREEKQRRTKRSPLMGKQKMPKDKPIFS